MHAVADLPAPDAADITWAGGYDPAAIVTCRCGATTLRVFSHCDIGASIARRCWVAINSDGTARLGCWPEDRSYGLVARRNITLERLRNPPAPRIAYPSGATIRCACRRLTRIMFSNVEEMPNPPVVADPPDPVVPIGCTSCWISIDESGDLAPGCAPDERTDGLLRRRNYVARRVYDRAGIIRCACGRLSRVHTSNLNCIASPPPVADPPDLAIPVGSTACWLAIDTDGGPMAGCTPDERTWDVLERRRRGTRPIATIELEVQSSMSNAPTAEERERFEALKAVTARPGPKAKAASQPQMLSLFDL